MFNNSVNGTFFLFNQLEKFSLILWINYYTDTLMTLFDYVCLWYKSDVISFIFILLDVTSFETLTLCKVCCRAGICSTFHAGKNVSCSHTLSRFGHLLKVMVYLMRKYFMWRMPPVNWFCSYRLPLFLKVIERIIG